ncbi:MAG: thiamine phosphate synthase [Rhodospirillales bacterium]|nr:thiamine phosphate synthase [Rhodospirillales bacterium]
MSLSEFALGLKRRNGRPGPPDLPHLILMTDGERMKDPLAHAARLPRGAAVCLRHYDDPGRSQLARDLMGLCREKGLKLFIGGDVGLAQAVGAHGLHLPEGLARQGSGAARGWLQKPGRILSAAAHSPAALFMAARIGAHGAILGSVFPTPSHPGGPVIGPGRFAAWCRASPLPVWGLGGINETTAQRLGPSGAIGIAGIGGI